MEKPPEIKEPTEADIGQDGTVICLHCETVVQLGSVGLANYFKRHKPSKACKVNKEKKVAKEALAKTQAKACQFFMPRGTAVPGPSASAAKLLVKPQTSRPATILPASGSQVGQAPMPILPTPSQTPSCQISCPRAATLLTELRARIDRLPDTIELAGDECPLARFSGSFEGSVPEGEDAWEVWNRPLDTELQKSQVEMMMLVKWGAKGLDVIYGLFEYLASAHNIPGALFEGKVGRLLQAIDDVSPQSPIPPTMKSNMCVILDEPTSGVKPVSWCTSPINVDTLPDEMDALDVDALPNVLPMAMDGPRNQEVYRKGPPLGKYPCPGVHVEIPEGKSTHSAYPFGLHDELGDPWDYSVQRGQLTLHARSCKNLLTHQKQCNGCYLLSSDSRLQGILDRMNKGVHENAHLVYHSVGGLVSIVRRKAEEIKTLKLCRLNDAEKLAGRAVAIDELKQWVMAVGSRKVEWVDCLVRVNLARKGGMHGLLNLYERAAQKLYRPRNYTEEDYLRGLLLWRLGGARLAGIGHSALNLPSKSSLHQQKVLPLLVISPSFPTAQEVKENVKNMFTPIFSVLEAAEDIVHQVLMLDELKVEERPQYDEKSNKIVGICHEHAKNTSLEYASEQEVQLLLESVKKGDIHLAVDVTVGAISVLSSDTRLYGARGILVSGDCKQESGLEHVQLIKTAFDASRKTRVCTVSIASDGESRRGLALVQFTFKKKLSPDSPIYDQLTCLPLMNLEVGDDDVTANKDYKHIFKHIRNLVLRDAGLWSLGHHLKPPVFRAHMHAQGVTMQRTAYLLNLEDRQDVKLAYDLLHEIWSLSKVPSGSFVGFQSNRASMRILGSLFQCLVMPYICIDLTLTRQLTHLSVAAHILMALWSNDKAGTKLMLTQLYVDIMIMIKNVYFCVAKAKVDSPTGKFYLILLGTDRLETLFGILRTMVGNDANLDILQLGQHLTGTTEVSTILAKYPHWDRAPRRLKLPVVSQEGSVMHKGVDHIRPSTWLGDVFVANIVFQTCWRLGREEAKKDYPVIAPILESIQIQPGRDIFSPLGKDLVKAAHADDDIDDTYDDTPTSIADSTAPSLGHELEDAIAEEEPIEVEKHKPFFEMDGVQVSKAKYLSRAFEMLKKVGSTDRLKRVANAATIWEWTCRLHQSSNARTVSSYVLVKSMTLLSMARVWMRSASILSDDPESKHDWRGSMRRGVLFKVSGHLIQPIDPGVSTHIPHQPYYLLESDVLLSAGASLLERVACMSSESSVLVPTIKKSADFPYREQTGQACFLCENEDAERHFTKKNQCSVCTPAVFFKDKTPAHRVLKHNAAHMLFDSHLKQSDELCGLCLCPAPINMKKSSCANMLGFSYSVAEESTQTAPCSNVPIRCPICPRTYTTPVLWQLNLEQHMKSRHHEVVNLIPYEHLWKISEAEKVQLKASWNDRHKEKCSCKSQKAASDSLIISETHSSRLVFRSLDNEDSFAESQSIDEDAGPAVVGARQQLTSQSVPCSSDDESDPGDMDNDDDESSDDEGAADHVDGGKGDVEGEGNVMTNGEEVFEPDPPNTQTLPDTELVSSLMVSTGGLATRQDGTTVDAAIETQTGVDSIYGRTVSVTTETETRHETHDTSTTTQTVLSPMSVEVDTAPKETSSQGRLRNVPKRKFIGECVCGGPVTADEMDDEDKSIWCKQKGCETNWVSNSEYIYQQRTYSL
ncbi:uncharacterized protein LACBIDRAFT_307198 [Laccaria bicolor S238N-H82]|uniref:Predicted protein n=1 Tax=Laccaria bicolor (strain S238N-H82 / ATCC MYA-4686) TaxID=486041 RepID=B0DPL8_LACBS|nr:uncharacterized protein LACBIDRAFT_307198 [Laccaria bicolor S238N-H82]EDR03397.1 predicted protein [Laccaria bicolor S238N-H82]|eukprot:XP_001885853.1 predicted protein [Laccaria bicolor S238N-H82]